MLNIRGLINLIASITICSLLTACGNVKDFSDNPHAHLLDYKFSCSEIGTAKRSSNSILILGDSTFTRGNACGSVKDVLTRFTSTKEVQNNSISSGEILNEGYRGVLARYTSASEWDYIIIGGGGTDLWKCGKNSTCHKHTSEKIKSKISTFIREQNIRPERLIFVYHTNVAANAPRSLKQAINGGGGSAIRKTYIYLTQQFPRSTFIDFTNLTGTRNPSMWERDGYHPTTEAYKRLVVDLMGTGILK